MIFRRLLLAAILILGFAQAAAAAPMLALVGGTVVVPDRATVIRADVLIDGARVAKVGPRLRLPRGTKVVNVHGRYVVPGLWDMHAHIAAIGPPGGAPERYVGYGVLGIRDMGGHLDVLTELRQSIAAGKRIGPDIYMAGPTLNGEAPADFHRVVRTDAEARTAVRELKAAGVDFIKIHRQTTREAFFAIADETRKQGLTFVGHVPLVLDWITASNAGMRTIEHIQTMAENDQVKRADPIATAFATADRLKSGYADKIFAVMAKNHTYFTPTLVGYEDTWKTDAPERAALKQKFYAEMKPLVLNAKRAGVPILAGTDVLERHGDLLLTELERLVGVGLTPAEALAAATRTPRELTGRGPGRIAANEEASLIVTDKNPLADIRNLRALHAVVLRGRVIDTPELERLRATKD